MGVQVFIATHEPAVPFEVADHRRQLPPTMLPESVFGRHLLQAANDVVHFATQQPQEPIRHGFLGFVTAFWVKAMRRLGFPSFAMRRGGDSGAWETRNPMLLFSFVGLLLRFDACRSLSLLLNTPPVRGRPRTSPSRRTLGTSNGPRPANRDTNRFVSRSPVPVRQRGTRP